MSSNYFITFMDKKRYRKVAYNEPRKIEILDGRAVRIKCADGFQTILKPEEWQEIEIERFDEDETED